MFSHITTLEQAWDYLENFHESLVRKRPSGLGYRAWISHNNGTFTGHGQTQLEAIINVLEKEQSFREGKK